MSSREMSLVSSCAHMARFHPIFSFFFFLNNRTLVLFGHNTVVLSYMKLNTVLDDYSSLDIK